MQVQLEVEVELGDGFERRQVGSRFGHFCIATVIQLDEWGGAGRGARGGGGVLSEGYSVM